MTRHSRHFCRVLSFLMVLGFFFSGTFASAQSTELDKLKQGLQSSKEQERADAIRRWKSAGADLDKAAEILVGALGDRSYQVQQAAQQVLQNMGEKAALPLAQGLQSKDNTRAQNSAHVLAELGPKAQAAAPVVVKVLMSNNTQIRGEVENVIRRMGKAAAPALAEALKTDNKDARGRVQQALHGIGADAAPALLALCKHGDDSAFWPAVAEVLSRSQLANQDPFPPDLVPILSRHLKDKDAKTRGAALQVVQSFSWRARPLAAALIPLLADPDAKLRSQAASLVSNIGQDALPFLIAELKNPSADIRAATLAMVDRYHWRTQEIWPSLLVLLKDKDARIRKASAVMFVHMQAPQSICHLGAALSDEDVEVRRAAAKTLEQLNWIEVPSASLGKGDARKAVIAAVVRGLSDKEESIRTQAVVVLKKIGAESVPEVLAGLKNENREGRIQAALLVISIDKNSKDPIPARKEAMKQTLTILLDTLDDNDEQVRRAAAVALGQIGKESAPSLIKLAVESKKLPVRLTALAALGMIREPGKEVVEALDKLTVDQTPAVRVAAVKAMGRLAVADPNNRVSVQKLLLSLNDSEWQIRQTASFGLKRMGGDAVSGLIATLEKSSDGPGRGEAVKVLGAIGLPARPAIKTLVFLIRSRDPNDLPLRTDAIVALTRMDAAESHAAIATLLNDDDSSVQAAVAGSLDVENAGLARDALVKLLSSPNAQVRSASARALTKVGAGILPDVEPLLADKEGDIRAAALQAIAGFEPAANLRKLLLDENLTVRELAASALVKKGPSTVPILTEALRSGDYRAQTAVADALPLFENRPDDLIPVLVEILLAKDAQELELRSAAKAIRRINPILGARILADKAQVPGLTALLKKEFSDVDELACLALAQRHTPLLPGGAGRVREDDEAAALVAAILKRPNAEANVLAAATRALAAVAPAQDKGKEKLDADLLARIVKGTQERSSALREEMMVALQTQSTGLGADSAATVLSALALGQVTEEVDQWIIRQANGKTVSDAASPNFVRILGLFHSGNKRFPGRLSPAAEQALKEHFRRFLQEHASKIATPPTGSANATSADDLLWMTSAYLALDVLHGDASFKGQKINERTVEELYTAWTTWWRAWARERALTGLSNEPGAYGEVSAWPCLLNLYDCAGDAVVKQRIKMLLDLGAIEEEQVSLNGVRAGRRLPLRPTAPGPESWKDVLQGENPRRPGDLGDDVAAIVWTTSYQLPPQAILLRQLNRPTPDYAVTDRDLAGGNVYAYATPHYILASSLGSTRRGLPQAEKSMEAPGALQRLVFDDRNAVVFPLVTGERTHMQHENVYIACWTAGEDARQKIEFTSELKVVERSGWVFLSNGPAFAGIHVQGGGTLGTTEKKVPGRQDFSTITLKNSQALVVLQAGDVLKFGSFEQFQDAVIRAPLRFSESSVKYAGPQAPAIEFFRDPAKASSIAGFKDNRDKVYDSPYLQGRSGDHQVTVRFGPYVATYDFETNLVKEGP